MRSSRRQRDGQGITVEPADGIRRRTGDTKGRSAVPGACCDGLGRLCAPLFYGRTCDGPMGDARLSQVDRSRTCQGGRSAWVGCSRTWSS